MSWAIKPSRTIVQGEAHALRKEATMGLFKKKVVKDIDGGAWGHLVSVHKIGRASCRERV